MTQNGQKLPTAKFQLVTLCYVTVMHRPYNYSLESSRSAANIGEAD